MERNKKGEDMDTREHTEVGNMLKFDEMGIKDNPYIIIDEQTGILSLMIQGLNDDNMPTSTNLKLTPGNVVAMSGDYFGGTEVSFDLPSLAEFKENPDDFNNDISLGHYLFNKPISFEDKDKFVRSYRKLANPQVTQQEIETIYKIDSANYIPFSSTLNGYVQEIMFAMWVKNYGEILIRNLSHFTPWSVRAYTVGHYLALKFARCHYEFKKLAENPQYTSNSDEFNETYEQLKQRPKGMSKDELRDLAYRFQVLAIGIELFSFHYYSDHFAAGHCQPMGDLRAILPEQFGTWGSILVNGLHDESNRVTIYTRRPYDPNPDLTAPPVEAGGDGDFDTPQNYYNKLACVAGMQASLGDLYNVFQGSPIPKQSEYAGLKHLPDIDPNYRQPQPLFVMGNDKKVYYRTELSKIRTLSPSQWKATYESPAEHGYTELNSKWQAFVLVFKLRVLSFIYQGTLQKLSEEELSAIEEEEHALNPNRHPIPRPPKEMEKTPDLVPQLSPVNWKKQSASSKDVISGLNQFGFLSKSSEHIDILSKDSEEQTISPSI